MNGFIIAHVINSTVTAEVKMIRNGESGGYVKGMLWLVLTI
jgi:hypothetical protein